MADYYVDGSGDAIPVMVNLDAYKGVPPLKPLSITVTPSSDWLDTSPVSLDAMKTYLRVDGTDEDALITGLMLAAVSYCQDVSNTTFVKSTISVTYADFPGSGIDALGTPAGSPVPTGTALSITYTDEGGVEQTLTLSGGDLVVAKYGQNVVVIPSADWPSDYDRTGPRQIELAYDVAADTANPGSQIQVAMQMLVGHWYNTRDAVCDGNPKEIPFGVKALLQNNTFYGGFV